MAAAVLVIGEFAWKRRSSASFCSPSKPERHPSKAITPSSAASSATGAVGMEPRRHARPPVLCPDRGKPERLPGTSGLQKISNVFVERNALHVEPCSPQQACRRHPPNRRAVVSREARQLRRARRTRRTRRDDASCGRSRRGDSCTRISIRVFGTNKLRDRRPMKNKTHTSRNGNSIP